MGFTLAPLIGIAIGSFFYKDHLSSVWSVIQVAYKQKIATVCTTGKNCPKDSGQASHLTCDPNKSDQLSQMVCALQERLKKVEAISGKTSSMPTADIDVANSLKKIKSMMSDGPSGPQKNLYKPDASINKDIQFIKQKTQLLISNVSKGSVWSRVGLQKGDAILRINGQVFSTDKKWTHMQNLYKEKGPHSLTVMRRGRPKSVIFSF